MKYEKIKINNCNIHIIKTKKFRGSTISVNFREKIKKEDITIRRFLFQMLCFSTLKYNTNRLFEIKLEDLYQTTISHSNIKFGNLINSYIDFKFLDKKYTNEDITCDVIDLLYEIILNPNVVDNKFDKVSFDTIKNRLYTSIISKKDDTAKYAISRAFNLMDENDSIAYDLWGNLEDLEKITPSNLYEYYKYMINNNAIDIFLVGDFKNDIIDKFKELKIGTSIDVNPYITYNDEVKPGGFIEDASITQSKLIMICKVLNITNYERKYVLPIYTNILGSSSTSRLFTNVREKNSLCYTIGTSLNNPNSIFTIYSGIDASNYTKVVKMVNKELKLKDITNDEVNASKMDIITSLDSIFDSPGRIINYYYGLEVFKSDTLENRIENYEKVTIEDLYKLEDKINLAFIYLLRGSHEE